MILSNEAIEYLNRILELKVSGNEQDWDLEMADPERLDDFITFFENSPSLDMEVKRALIALLVASLNEKLNDFNRDYYFYKFFSLMKGNQIVFKEVCDSWQINSLSESEDQFNVSSLLYDLREKIDELKKGS